MQNLSLYLTPFLSALLLSLVLIRLLLVNATRLGFYVDGKVPRSGGASIIMAFFGAVLISGRLELDAVKVGILLCSALILVFGLWDDRRELSWRKQLIFQLIIALVMLAFGLGVDYIANPFGGHEFRLDSVALYGIPVLGTLFVILWLVGLMNVVNWLDGLDGLAGGVGAVATTTIFFLSIGELVNQPALGMMAAALTGALVGFLFYNRPPARVYMGTSGSYFLGFMLAVMAIFAGGKIATLFMVMGFPILDAFWVVIKRLREGRSPFAGDRSHLQYNLLDRGWSAGEAVAFLCLLSAAAGFLAIGFSGAQKFVALVALLVAALWLIAGLKFRRPEGRHLDNDK